MKKKTVLHDRLLAYRQVQRFLESEACHMAMTRSEQHAFALALVDFMMSPGRAEKKAAGRKG